MIRKSQVASSLYVHIPFCVFKCHYCDFVSYTDGDKDDYLSALMKEADLYADQYQQGSTQIETLYVGGGTPTCLSAQQLDRLLTHLRLTFAPHNDAEITVEGNPGTIDAQKLQVLKAQGVNRLSLGVQSLADHELKVLGRIHRANDVVETYNLARRLGFENINLDLMYGLPGQQFSGWQKNLRSIVALEPEHISLYQLNIEKGTPFYALQNKGLLSEFSEDEALLMYGEAIDYLTDAGYYHYEIGNFAQPGFASRHNQVYWKNREYVGIGAGASGYERGCRYTNLADLASYETALMQGQKPVAHEETIDDVLAMSETMFLGLRMMDGVDKNEFFLRFGIQVHHQYGEAIKKLTTLGLLEETSDRLKLTRKGLYLANQVMLEFV